MSDPRTSYLDLIKPIVNDEAGEDLWGDKLNGNFDILDQNAFDVADALTALQTTALTDAPLDGALYGRMSGNWEVVPDPSVVGWEDIQNRPETFPPAPHQHTQSEVANLPEDLEALRQANLAQDTVIAGKEPAIAPGNPAYAWAGDKTWKPIPLPTWDQVSGKPATFPPSAHAHVIADVTGLQSALDGKEPAIAPGNASYFWAGDKTWKAVPAAGIPEAPTDGQAYSRKGSTASWVVATGGGATVEISDTPPAGAQPKSLWWNSATGALMIRFDDGSSQQWVECGGAGMFNGGTLTGDLTISKIWPAVVLNKPASGTGSYLAGQMTGKHRWIQYLGDNVAESGSNSGSNYTLLRYDDAGNQIDAPLSISRSSGDATFAASATFAGNVTAGAIYLVNGVYSPGYRCRAGVSGAYGATWFVSNWTGTALQGWVDATNLGSFSFTSDYRVKKDVADLPSTWDRVKALRPISYTQAAAFDGLFVADDIVRWGFIAHELQDTLIMSAADGVKDAPNQAQSPNPWTILAALTKTVQEMQARLETLEAAR